MRSRIRGCMIADSTDCGNGTACRPGFICSHGSGCVPENTADCGNGRYCSSDLKCSPDGQQCLSRMVACAGYSCNEGMKCASGNKCVGEADQDCGNGRSCSLPFVCYRGGQECLTVGDIESRRLQEEIGRLAGIPEGQQQTTTLPAAQDKRTTGLKLPSGPVGQIESPPPPSAQPVKKPNVLQALAGPAVVKTQGEGPKDIPILPPPDKYHADAAIVAGAEILGAINNGRAGALKAGKAVGTAVGIYGDVADGAKTLTDIAQHKDMVTIAHDVQADMWDIINTASPLNKLKPMASVGAGALEKKGTAVAEEYLTNLIYEKFYKPKPSSSGGAR